MIFNKFNKYISGTTLNIYAVRLTIKDIQDLGSFLQENPDITQLDFLYNNIGYEGAKALATELAKLQNLTTLNLKGNRIGDEGATNLTSRQILKKAIYATMIASPFIAAGVYAAVALSTGIVEFNPIIAAGIFVGVVALSAICFATAKACGKVSEEKSENSGVRSYIASNNGIFSECFKSSGATVS